MANMKFRFCVVILTLILLCEGRVSAQEKVEETFKDEKTGLSGKFTVGSPKFLKAKSLGLIVFFHGSSQTEVYASSFGDLQRLGKELNLVPLAIQAPNGASTWPNHARGPSNRHDDYAHALIDTVLKKMPVIDDARIVLAGLSAGSTFLSGDFLPRFINEYRGGAVMLCGGGGPLSLDKDLFLPLDKSTRQNFPLAFYIQSKDFLLSQTREGINYWKARKAKVNEEILEGGSHCGFDVYKEMARLSRIVLSRS